MKKEKSPLKLNEEVVKQALKPSLKEHEKGNIRSLLEPTKTTMARRMKEEELGVGDWYMQETANIDVAPTNPDYQTMDSDSEKTPFKQYSKSTSRIRDEYLPSQHSGSPLNQLDHSRGKNEEFEYGVQNLEESNISIYDNIKHIPEEQVEEAIKSMVDNDNYVHGVDPVIMGLPNREWRMSVKRYFGNIKEDMLSAIDQDRADLKDGLMENARTVISWVQQFVEKREQRKSMLSDETPGNVGGDLLSKGSHKGDKRKWDLTYLGTPGIKMDIAEEGIPHFMMQNIDDIWTVGDLDANTYTKDFAGIKKWKEFKNAVRQQGLSGVALNEPWVEGTANTLTQTKEGVLQWLHDDNDGDSLFSRFAKAFPDFGDWGVFMPESDLFNLGVSRDVVRNGLKEMAVSIYNAAKESAEVSKDVIQKTKLSAKEMIEKYSKK